MYKYIHITQIIYCFSNVSLCVAISESQKFACTGRDLCSPPLCQNRLVLYNYSERIISTGRIFKACDFCHFSQAEDLTNQQFLEFKRLLTSIFSSQKVTP